MVQAKKKIAVSLFMGMSLRNFFTTGILERLKKEQDVTVLTISEQMKSCIQSEYHVQYMNQPSRLILKILSWSEPLQYYAFHYSRQPQTTIKYVQRDREEKPVKGFFYRLIGKIWASMDNIFPPPALYKFLARFWDIDLSPYDSVLLLSYDVSFDKLLAGKASLLGLPIYIVVHSWDNLPSRGYLPARPHKLLVWNEQMVDQALKYHYLKRNEIVVFGAPQFQYYERLSKNLSEVDLKKFNHQLVPRKFITYCCSASRVFPDEPLFIRELLKISKELGLTTVLRLHPNERVQEYLKEFQREGIIFSRAGNLFSAGSPKAQMTKSEAQEVEEFILLMKYPAAVVNLASTTTMDAIALNTPVVCVKFNLDPKISHQWNKVEDWYISDHYPYLLKHNAILLGHSAGELKEMLLACYKGNAPWEQMHALKKEFVTELNYIDEFVKGCSA